MIKTTAVVLFLCALLGLPGVSQAQSASGPIITVNDLNEFQTEVKNSTLPVFVVFTSGNPQCSPCQQEEPLVAKAAADYAGKVKFIRVDAAKTPDIAVKNGIKSVPAVFMIKPQEAKSIYHLGFIGEPDLHQFVDDGIKMKAPAGN